MGTTSDANPMSRWDCDTPIDFPRAKLVPTPRRDGNLTELLEDLERQLILQTLRRHNKSQTKAADALGIKRTTLRYKMEKYGLV